MLPLEKPLGFLGYRLGHSLSPLMINKAIEELRLPYQLLPFGWIVFYGPRLWWILSVDP